METSLRQFLILVLFLSICFGSVRTKCLKDQQSLLLQFKKTVTYNPTYSSKLPSWDPSKECCSWLGVTCDSNGHITRLDLSNDLITGSISSLNWPVFSKLESLELRNNSLSGTIPASLFAIPSLLGLYLNQNQFLKLNGPSKLSSSPLESLDLRENKLGGSFPNFIFQFRSLRSIELSRNYFTGPVKINLFEQLKNLTSLDLSYNHLWIDETGSNPASIPKIHTIYLSSCKLTKFPDFLKEQSRIYGILIFLTTKSAGKYQTGFGTLSIFEL